MSFFQKLKKVAKTARRGAIQLGRVGQRLPSPVEIIYGKEPTPKKRTVTRRTAKRRKR